MPHAGNSIMTLRQPAGDRESFTIKHFGVSKIKNPFGRIANLNLERYGMSDCTPVKIPLNPGVANSITIYEGQADKSTIAWY